MHSFLKIFDVVKGVAPSLPVCWEDVDAQDALGTRGLI